MDERYNTQEEKQEIQDRIVRSMQQFSAENPTIAEAITVMNMTMPDYFQAMEAIRGGQVVSASSYVTSDLSANC